MRRVFLDNEQVRRFLVPLLGLFLALAPPAQAARARGEPDPPPAGGLLSVASEPPGATVFLDGEARGATPLSLGGLPPGDHRVRVVKPGYLDNSRVLSLRSGEPRALQVKLTPHSPEPLRSVQVEDNKQQEKKGGSKKALWIGLAAVGAGVGTYLLLPKNEAPTPGTIGVSPTGAGLQGVTSFTFTAQGASDPDGDSLTYSWSFSDGGSATGQTTTRVFMTAGSISVNLTVSDGKKSAMAPAANVTVRNLTGAWRGNISGFPFSFNLTQTGTSVTGTYSDADGPGTVSGSVSSPRNVTLTVNQPPFSPFTFAGSADAEINTISGSVFGFPFTMTR